MKFPVYRQSEQMDCGIASLRMVAAYHGKFLNTNEIRKVLQKGKDGVSLNELCEAAEKLGLKANGLLLDVTKLKNTIKLPCILFWEDGHFLVLYKIKRNRFYLADPASGIKAIRESEFIDSWVSQAADKGIALTLYPSIRFQKQESKSKAFSSSKMAWNYLGKHLPFLRQLLLALLMVSIIQLSFPLITQAIVDQGIRLKDLSFIKLLLIAQIFLFLGRTSIEAIRGWLLLHMSARINIQILSDYLVKLMRLPYSFFDVRMTGDILQRVNDHKRIESLLTNGSLNFIFSIFNLIIFGFVLLTYDWRIFSVYLLGSSAYLIWVLIFMKERKKIDYQRFGKMGEDQSMVIEMIEGMKEIKLNNAERIKRWQWEQNQLSLYQIGIKGLKLEQLQRIVGNVINELKNILLTFLSAYLVIKGELTLGMMLAITFILGQLNSPLSQLIGFSYTFQDAKIAFERIKEVYTLEDELDDDTVSLIGKNQIGIELSKVNFSYPASKSKCLVELSLKIPAGKTTAIVGKSGSGKSSLMKLILQFYQAEEGRIYVNQQDLNGIDKKEWRSVCGVVMQDGHLFNDTIEGNIIMNQQTSASDKMSKILKLANLEEWINELPKGLKTKIGIEGIGISGGQKQRILIARALYKEPTLLLFDEATSSLDAANEKEISDQLKQFFKQRTVIIIAHRLSTIRDADQIVMMDSGRILEVGHHTELMAKKGAYASLIDKQIHHPKELCLPTEKIA